MRRISAFERDFRDLHGRTGLREIRAEIVEPMPTRSMFGVDHVGLRLTLGALGLFWGIVLAVLLVGGVVVLAAMLLPPAV